MNKLLLMGWGIGAWAITSFAAPFAAGQDVQNLLGAWGGFQRQVGNPEIRPGTAELEVTRQFARKFDALFINEPEDAPEAIRVRGTVSASGVVNAVSDDARPTVMHWELEEFDSGAAILSGRTKFARGSQEPLQATLLFRDPEVDPENPPPDAEGDYTGTAESFAGEEQKWRWVWRQRDDSVAGYLGELTIAYADGHAITARLRGAVDLDGHVVVIGASSQFLVLCLGDILPSPLEPARIEGVYEFYFPDGEEGLGGPDTIVDMGRFVITQDEEIPEPKAAVHLLDEVAPR